MGAPIESALFPHNQPQILHPFSSTPTSHPSFHFFSPLSSPFLFSIFSPFLTLIDKVTHLWGETESAPSLYPVVAISEEFGFIFFNGV